MSAGPVRKPMKAADYEEDKLRFPYLASVKLDGYRAFSHDAILRTSAGTPVTNAHTQSLYAGSGFEGLDGELIVGAWNDKNAFWNTSGPVRKVSGEPAVGWYIFDDRTDPGLGFERRNDIARQRVEALREAGHRSIIWIPQVLIHDLDDLATFEGIALDEGFEGVMLRSPAGPHKFGRSTVNENLLLKVKRFVSEEATITSLVEQVENLNQSEADAFGHAKKSVSKDTQVGTGMVGAFTVRSDRWPTEFRISASSMSHDDRRNAWANPQDFLGELARFKYLPHGVVDVPRHGVFEAIRGKEDT